MSQDLPGLAVNNFQGLNDLKRMAHQDAQKAIPQVAKQFEAIFLQAMLKSMRVSSSVLEEDSLFNSKHEENFRDMLDSQYADHIANGKGMGLAEALTKQLMQQTAQMAEPQTAEKQTAAIDKKNQSELVPIEPVSKKSANGLSEKVKSFVDSVLPYAKEAAAMLGLDPKILLAQAALETGWGMFVAKDGEGNSSNNYFNIKGRAGAEGQTVKVQTTEFLGGKPVKMADNFRKYDSPAEGFKDYVNFIKGNQRYQDAMQHASDPERYVDELHRAGYATDPLYVQKILAIYHSEDLNQALDLALDGA